MPPALSHSANEQPAARGWLAENGPRELELLLRAIVYRQAASILVADDQRKCREASAGAVKLLGRLREKIIGHNLDDFGAPEFNHQSPELWEALIEEGEQKGSFRLDDAEGSPPEIGYTAKSNVLPQRHVLVLHDHTLPEPAGKGEIASKCQDYAMFLLDGRGRVVEWYSGAVRIYGYTEVETAGKSLTFLYAGLSSLSSNSIGHNDSSQHLNARLDHELNRSAANGHFGQEGWQVRRDGTQFWANCITVALRDEDGDLQGFAGAVRDFSDVYKTGEKTGRGVTVAAHRTNPSIAGIVSGEFDRIPEANDAFLELTGYDRDDLQAGRLRWPDLTPPEYLVPDELAHEEELRFGACTPYEKELIRKDGSRIPILVVTAVLKLVPFRWITFVQDLRERDRLETIDDLSGGQTDQDSDEMVGDSALLQRVKRLVAVVAPTDATVLILGETGTGKELVAHAIHRRSPRKNLPFLTLNCAAIPTGLLESELFGYERGAFTGALTQKIGRFEMANRGTLFLDEVGDIPLELQPKLLRALQEKSFERLGGTKTIPIDVRLVAATNRNLTQMMGDKLFRSDLYYRLKVFPITVPPLRDHPEDIPTLARHFTAKYAGKMNRQINKIPVETMRALVAWPWPGNVRELENFVERSVILSTGSSLRAPLDEIRPNATSIISSSTLEQVEREHILRVLGECSGVITAAATRLGLHRTTLNALMKRLGISRNDL
jgi:PAS domain S-box-containing protein